MLDQDTRAVIARLDEAMAKSGLSMRQFAHALGTSASRYSTYRAGNVAPSAAFLMRAERIADSLAQARRDNVPTVLDAVESLIRAASKGDDWTYSLVLEARDRLRDLLRHSESLAGAWEAQPALFKLDVRWAALIAAFVSHEFDEAGRAPPRWTDTARLDQEWVLETPRLSDDQIREQTPDWLAARNIFIAAKDLVTL